MDPQKHQALVITQYGKNPELKEIDVPKLNNGQLLIKVQASTINPVDKIFIAGQLFVQPLPIVAGFQGSGRVLKAEGEEVQHWIGKRVCFHREKQGAWGSYSINTPALIFQIDDDVPLQSASSGYINPITTIGMVEICKQRKLKGIIHTAAASALGRMLNKLCQKQKIPLLNIVRREEQAQVLRSEGAENVLITTGDWQAKFKEYVEKDGFDCLFDALGGGNVTNVLIENMKIPSGIFIYGGLTGQQIKIKNVGKILAGNKIEGYMLPSWWNTTSQETKKRVRSNYSNYLKNQLSTKTFKQLTYKQLEQALEISIKNTLDGKVLLVPK